MFDKISSFLIPIAGKLNNNRYLGVLRDAFMLAFPLTVFGSMVVVLLNLPFLDKFLSADTISTLSNTFGVAQSATMSIMTVFVVFGIGYYLSKSYDVEAVFGGVVALASFLFLTPFVVETANGEVVTGVLSLDRLGAKGMFLGMITAFVAGEIYRKIVQKDITIKMPAGVPPAVAKSFAALIPAFITLTVFLFINAIVVLAFETNLHDVIYSIIQKPLTGLGSGLIPTLIVVFLIQLLWFFGLHGQIILNSVMDPIWLSLSLENLEAFKAGEQVPHIISKTFMDTFTVGMGGTGMTLAVVAAILVFVKSKQMKQVAKLGAAPGIFNVNEPIIFGLPIVMNPLILIPWIISPMVVVIFTYFVMKLGWVPAPTGVVVPWTVPIGFSGYLATNSIMGSLLQIANFFIVFAIWLPFLKVIDRVNLKKEEEEAKAAMANQQTDTLNM